MYSIRVKESFTGEAGLCIRVDCFFTVPQSVSDPIKRTWFKGDPQNPAVQVPCVGNLRECSFLLNHLVQGESDGEYRLKLEWEQGEVFIFPQTVHITVKGWLCVCLYAFFLTKITEICSMGCPNTQF